MEIFVRLFVWILNFTYGQRRRSSLYGQNPMDEVLLREHQEESESKRKDRIVEDFKSAVAPVQGAVDYEEMKWESFSRVVETPEQFLFYSDRSLAKIIAKSSFSSRQQVLALRRVIRRHVANSELLGDL
jgi:YcxB-like protein